MESGTVKWFDEAKGYGCISRENGEEVLMPISAIQASGFQSLKPGEVVQFNVVKRPEGLQAEDVSLLPGQHDVKCKPSEVGVPIRSTRLREWAAFYEGFQPLKITEDVSRAMGAIQADTIVGGHGMLRGVRKSLGIRGALKSDADLVERVEERLPVAAISALIEHGILEKEIYSVIVPRRTLQHRRARKEKLSREESDRAVRLARLVTLTENVFGKRDAGMRWLRAPKKRFHGRTPMDMMATETGSRLVEEMLYQIDEGMAA
jgi:putative toxin-antitoxin system antitoxin component (TIGR02293 family)